MEITEKSILQLKVSEKDKTEEWYKKLHGIFNTI